MLIKVRNDDRLGYKNNNDWIPEHPSKAIIFDKPQGTWEQLSPEYTNKFKDLVTGELPPEKDLVKTLRIIANRMIKINWEIKYRVNASENIETPAFICFP